MKKKQTNNIITMGENQKKLANDNINKHALDLKTEYTPNEVRVTNLRYMYPNFFKLNKEEQENICYGFLKYVFFFVKLLQDLVSLPLIIHFRSFDISIAIDSILWMMVTHFFHKSNNKFYDEKMLEKKLIADKGKANNINDKEEYSIDNNNDNNRRE